MRDSVIVSDLQQPDVCWGAGEESNSCVRPKVGRAIGAGASLRGRGSEVVTEENKERLRASEKQSVRDGE